MCGLGKKQIKLIFPDVLRYVGAQSVSYPPEFEIHSHLKKHHVENRLKRLESGAGIDWGTAEALAIGSLLYQVSSLSSCLLKGALGSSGKLDLSQMIPNRG